MQPFCAHLGTPLAETDFPSSRCKSKITSHMRYSSFPALEYIMHDGRRPLTRFALHHREKRIDLRSQRKRGERERERRMRDGGGGGNNNTRGSRGSVWECARIDQTAAGAQSSGGWISLCQRAMPMKEVHKEELYMAALSSC